MMTGISEQCVNRWHAILPRLGISPQFLTGKHTKCPACGGKDRFRFDDKDGRGTFYCNACGAGNGVDLVMRVYGKTFREAADMIREVAPDAEQRRPPRAMSDERRIEMLREMWRQSAPISEDDDAGRYLLSRRIIPPFSPALRFIPKLKVTGAPVDHLAAMIAMVRDPLGEPLTLHRTYLSGGRKANIDSPRKMMPGKTPHGSFIELSPAAEDMGVAEGIETALRAQQRFGVPVWSLINADGLKAFTPPPIVKRLRIFGDNDLNYIGQLAAFALANRMAIKNDHIAVSVEIPPEPGTDWADVE